MEIHVNYSERSAINRELLSVADAVTDGVQSGLRVALSSFFLLIEALDSVASSMGSVMNMIECVGDARQDIVRSVNFQPGVFEANVELVVFQAPSPVFVRHSVHQPEVFVSYEENATDERWLRTNFY